MNNKWVVETHLEGASHAGAQQGAVEGVAFKVRQS